MWPTAGVRRASFAPAAPAVCRVSATHSPASAVVDTLSTLGPQILIASVQNNLMQSLETWGLQLSQPPAQIHMLLQPSSLCYGFSKRADKSSCKTQWRVSQRGWLQMWLSSALLNKTSSCCFEQCVVTTTRHLVKKRKPRTIHPDFKTSPFSSPTDFSRQVQIICQ